MKIRFTLLSLLLLFAFEWTAQSQQMPLLSTEALKEDFQVFQNSIQDIHPGLYWYNDTTTIVQRFRHIEEQIGSGLELKTWYALLQEFYAKINCGHSWMSVPYAWRKQLEEGPYQLPFDIYFEKDKATLLNDLTPDQLLTKSHKVKTINGEPIMEVFNQLLQYAPSDGYNLTRRRQLVAWNFSRYYQTFIRHDSTVSLTLVSPSGAEKEVQMKALQKSVADSTRSARESLAASDDNALAAFKMINAETGYLRLKTFARGWLKNRKINYDKFLKSTFAQLQQSEAKVLVLDLRGNGGGSDTFGAKLCQYLIPNEFNYFDRMETVTSKFKYRKYSSTRWFNWVGVLFRKDKEQPGLYTFNYHSPLETQKPQKTAFTGQLIVLTDGGTFSTAADVASILHANNRAVFVGEEVGGGYYGNNSAIQYQIKLPNSGITYYIPVVRYYSSVDFPEFYGHGVKPDIAVSPSYEDFIAGRDTVLEKAIEAIK